MSLNVFLAHLVQSFTNCNTTRSIGGRKQDHLQLRWCGSRLTLLKQEKLITTTGNSDIDIATGNSDINSDDNTEERNDNVDQNQDEELLNDSNPDYEL